MRQKDADVERAPGRARGENSGLVSGHAPAEAAVDQVKVFLSFVPFQDPDRNTQRSRDGISVRNTEILKR